MRTFQGKVVLVTGASSGIGEALARNFAKEGASVALLARRLDRLQALAGKLQKFGTKAMAIACDVTRDGDLEAAVAKVHESLGLIDVVVANAGFGVIGPIAELQLEDYRRQFETNVFGVLRTVYATLGDLKKTKGRLALLGSVSGHISAPEASPYSMSKYAVRALADALYAELAPVGISVTLISPGFVESEVQHVDNRGVYHEKAKHRPPKWLIMPTDRAARQMVRAVRRRSRERVITLHGKIFVIFDRLFPGLTPRLFRLLSKRMRREKAGFA